ncbi:MAG TPA: T9SS type A sorting domain-containing protein [Candidatus Kapabacteria bacterium]|nr:T9SS type A sorting domain-containing protein [Candidatus Kapabacteria bacterium]
MNKHIKYIIALFFLLLCQLQSAVKWEHLYESKKAINLVFTPTQIIECKQQYYLSYFPRMSYKDETSGQIKTRAYPAILSFDKNGNILFQNEEASTLYDSFRAKGYTTFGDVNEYYCSDEGPVLVIQQGQPSTYSRPNYYKYSSKDGSLLELAGGSHGALMQSIYYYKNHNNLFVIGPEGLDRECSIIVYEFADGVGDGDMVYRIKLNSEPFRDLFDYNKDGQLRYLCFANDSTFFGFYAGYGGNTIIAKYSFDRDSASKLIENNISGYDNLYVNAKLLNYSLCTPEQGQSLTSIKKLENGNFILIHRNGGQVMINENGEIISSVNFTKKNNLEGFTVVNVLPLQHNPGYYAVYGLYKLNNVVSIAVFIADSLWNKVDELVWNYKNALTMVWDVKEVDNGDFVVLGQTLVTTPQGNKYYPYITGINFNSLVGVEESNNDNKDIFIQPNPATDYISIMLNNAGNPLGSEIGSISSIEIYNAMGKKVLTNTTQSIQQSYKMDIKNLVPGVYFVKVSTNDQMNAVIKKFVKF